MKSVATIIHGKDKDKTLLAAIEHHRYILIRCLANWPGAADLACYSRPGPF